MWYTIFADDLLWALACYIKNIFLNVLLKKTIINRPIFVVANGVRLRAVQVMLNAVG